MLKARRHADKRQPYIGVVYEAGKRVAPLILIAVLLLGSINLPAAEETSRVPRWEPHDFAFTDPATSTNPFQVPFSAAVTGPKGTHFIVPGFYDGAATWKIRVLPT